MVHALFRQSNAAPQKLTRQQRGNKTMTTAFSPDVFPALLFPDAELENVALGNGELTVSVTGPDSEWFLSEADDAGLFFGEGDMIFHYEGAAALRWRQLAENNWHEGDPGLPARSAALDFIRREAADTLLFQFSNREEDLVVTLLLEGVTRIEWTGETDEELEADYL